MKRLLFITLVLASALSCRADDMIRQGGPGESCNGRDADCREGLICQARVCREVGPDVTYDCDDICERLGECEAIESGCPSDCRITTSGWRRQARERFGVCIVEELDCAEAASDFAPQTCYARIPVPAERAAVCSTYGDAVRSCGASLDETEVVLERCTAAARVARSNEWSLAAECEEQARAQTCGPFIDCLNFALELESPLSL